MKNKKHGCCKPYTKYNCEEKKFVADLINVRSLAENVQAIAHIPQNVNMIVI